MSNIPTKSWIRQPYLCCYGMLMDAQDLWTPGPHAAKAHVQLTIGHHVPTAWSIGIGTRRTRRSRLLSWPQQHFSMAQRNSQHRWTSRRWSIKSDLCLCFKLVVSTIKAIWSTKSDLCLSFRLVVSTIKATHLCEPYIFPFALNSNVWHCVDHSFQWCHGTLSAGLSHERYWELVVRNNRL